MKQIKILILRCFFNFIFLLSPVVIFSLPDSSDASCSVSEIWAVEMFDTSPLNKIGIDALFLGAEKAYS